MWFLKVGTIFKNAVWVCSICLMVLTMNEISCSCLDILSRETIIARARETIFASARETIIAGKTTQNKFN